MSENGAPALKRGLMLLEIISQSQVIGFNQLRERSGLNTSSLNRLLKTLCDEDYIAKNRDGKYERGMKLFTISYGASAWQPLTSSIRKALDDISRRYSVTALFVVFLQSGSYILDKAVCPDNIAMRDIGDLAKDYTHNPWGFLRLRQMSDYQREEAITTAHSGYNIGLAPLNQSFKSFMDFIDEHGYSDDFNLVHKNIRRIAVPVYGSGQRAVAALAAGSFANLTNNLQMNDIAISLLKHAKVLSKTIQGNGDANG